MIPTVIRLLMSFFLHSLRFFLYPLVRFCAYRDSRRLQPLPVPGDPLLGHSARKLARLIRTRQVSCEEAVRAYVVRAQEVQPTLNAVVQGRYEAALAEAAQMDRALDAGFDEARLEKEAPLFGVPVSVKESIPVKGLSNNAGRVQRHSGARIAPVPCLEDAEVVRLVRVAGGIPFLVSNTPELCMFWETYNNATGKTRNPYDTRKTCGGSSGGEASLLGAGASLLGIGSDIGGSLRLPALYCGVYGHKPTPRTVSTQGHVPGCTSQSWDDFFSVGPMVRFAEDLPLLLGVMAKENIRQELRLNEAVSMKDIKIFYMENDNNSHFTDAIDPCMIQAMRKYVSYLEMTHGIKAQKVNIKQMKNAFEIAVSILLDIDGVENIFSNKENPGNPKSICSELFRFLTGRSDSILPAIMYGVARKLSRFTKKRTDAMIELNSELKQEFLDLLGDTGVFLFPTFTGPAHFHYEMYFKLLNIAYMAIFNTLGLPVTNCPVGFNSDGLPIGLQVVANPYQDRLSMAVAADMENYFGGWKPPHVKRK